MRECRKEQIRPCQTPDDPAFGAGGNACHEQGRRRAIYGSGAPASEFVNRTSGKTAAWKHRVDRAHPERQTLSLLRDHTFQRGDAITQIRYDMLARSSHRSRNPSGSCGLGERLHAAFNVEVHVLFLRTIRVKGRRIRNAVLYLQQFERFAN